MSKTNIRINGDRIYLRKVELSDVDQEYVDWLNDPDVNQFLETRHEIQTIDSICRYVEGILLKNNELFLAICLKKDGKHIGNIKLGSISLEHLHGEISLFIGDKSQWGKGLATESVLSLTKYAFNVLKLHKVTAGCYENNAASKKLFNNALFNIEGLWREYYLYNGAYVDRICFSRLTSEIND